MKRTRKRIPGFGSLKVKGQRKQLINERLPESCRQHGNNMTSSQDNFYALQLLGFQGQRVTKSTATKSKLNTLRHFSEDLRTVQDEGHQHEWPPLLGVMHRRDHAPTLRRSAHGRADVPLGRSDVPLCRHSRESRASDTLSVSQNLADNFEHVMVTYASIFTGPQAQIPSSPYQQGLGLVRG